MKLLTRGAILSLVSSASFFAAAAQFDVRDHQTFNTIVPADARVEKLGTGMQFLEGPVWVPREGGYLVFSDIPKNQLKKWTSKEGITTFREPSQNANGNCVDKKERLLTAEHSGRRISRTDLDGTIHTVVDSYQGKKLNSPNDVVVHKDGTIWFTDPDYGIKPDQKEQAQNRVYRFDPKSGSIESVIPDQPFDKPNGLCFSPDGKRLYVADSGAPRHIRVFDVERGGKLKNGRVFCKIDKGAPDGIRCDTAGRLYSSAGDGVQIFDPEGHLIGKIFVPESPANLCFGGKDFKTLYITARTSLYAIPLSVKGAR